MKKIFIGIGIFLVLAISVNANDNQEMNIEGHIVTINNDDKSFVISDNRGEWLNFVITPSTVISYYNSYLGPARFSDIDVGAKVKIKSYSGKHFNIANEINMYK